MNVGVLIPEIVMVVTFIAMLGANYLVEKKYAVGIVGLTGLLVGGLSLKFLSSNLGQMFGGTFIVDGYSIFFKGLLMTVAGVVIIISFKYVEEKEVKAGEFYSLIISATLGMLIMVSSYSLITIYVGLELMSISAYILTGIFKEDKRSVEAALKYFLVGALTSALMLFGMSLLYGITGTVDIVEIAQILSTGQGLLTSIPVTPVLMTGLVFLVTGFGFKVAAVPFHMWAPDTYHGAPTSITAFLIAGSEAAAFATLMRVFNVGLGSLSGTWSTMISIMALLSMTIGNIGALTQDNVKRMMAYSAIAQAGYVLVAVAVATQPATISALYYLLVYAFMILGCFTVIIMVSNNVNSEEIDDFRGLSEKAPLFAAAMTVFFLSMVGIPPTGGFLGKFYIFKAAVGSNYLWLALIMAINSVISLPYYFGVVRNMYLEKSRDEKKLVIPIELKFIVAISVIVVLGLGIVPQSIIELVEVAVNMG
jgi:NADH-quinone oxidoreductase subunit N